MILAQGARGPGFNSRSSPFSNLNIIGQAFEWSCFSLRDPNRTGSCCSRSGVGFNILSSLNKFGIFPLGDHEAVSSSYICFIQNWIKFNHFYTMPLAQGQIVRSSWGVRSDSCLFFWDNDCNVRTAKQWCWRLTGTCKVMLCLISFGISVKSEKHSRRDSNPQSPP